MIKLIVFDVYKTILHVGPSRSVSDEEWNGLWNRFFLDELPPLTYAGFKEATRDLIQSDHAKAEIVGVHSPEVFWDDLVIRVLPRLKELNLSTQKYFFYKQIQLEREVGLMRGAGEGLAELKQTGILLGVASNAQGYTFRELDLCLGEAGMDRSLFHSDFCCWSFLNGFSKPNSHVFRILTAKASYAGIQPGEILMVGDRIDNDIQPAEKQGWQTWHLNAQTEPSTYRGGDWEELMQFIKGQIFQ